MTMEEADAWAEDRIEKLMVARGYNGGEVRMDRWYVKCTWPQYLACKRYIRSGPVVGAHGLDKNQWSFVFEFTEFHVPRHERPDWRAHVSRKQPWEYSA